MCRYSYYNSSLYSTWCQIANYEYQARGKSYQLETIRTNSLANKETYLYICTLNQMYMAIYVNVCFLWNISILN